MPKRGLKHLSRHTKEWLKEIRIPPAVYEQIEEEPYESYVKVTAVHWMTTTEGQQALHERRKDYRAHYRREITFLRWAYKQDDIDDATKKELKVFHGYINMMRACTSTITKIQNMEEYYISKGRYRAMK